MLPAAALPIAHVHQRSGNAADSAGEPDDMEPSWLWTWILELGRTLTGNAADDGLVTRLAAMPLVLVVVANASRQYRWLWLGHTVLSVVLAAMPLLSIRKQ